MKKLVVLFVALTIALPNLAAAKGIAAQNSVEVGGQANDFDSSHWDMFMGFFLFGMAFPNASSSNKWAHTVQLVAGGGVGHEWDGGTIFQGLGGVRVTHPNLYKWPIYLEATAGILRYPGESVLVIHPNLGVNIPLPQHKFNMYVQLGLPILQFSNGHETGLEAAGGIVFDLGK